MSDMYFWLFAGFGFIAFLGCMMFSIYFSRIRQLHYSDRTQIRLFSAIGFTRFNIFAVFIFGLIIGVFQNASGIVVYKGENDPFGITQALTSLVFSLSLAPMVVLCADIFIYRVLSLKFKKSAAATLFGYWLPVLTTLSILLIVTPATSAVLERENKQQEQRNQIARQALLPFVAMSLERELGSVSKARCPDPLSTPSNFPEICYPVNDTVTTVRAAADRAFNPQAIQPGEWNDYGSYSAGNYRLRDSSQFNVLIMYTPRNDMWLASEKDGEYWGPYRPDKSLLNIVIQ